MNEKPYKIRNSANDLYNVYVNKELLHEYKNGSMITEGIYDLANNEDCYWLLDLIFLLQEYIVYHSEIQAWELIKVSDNSFNLSWSNEKRDIIFENNDMNVSFYFDYLKIIKKGNLLCLPIEENLY